MRVHVVCEHYKIIAIAPMLPMCQTDRLADRASANANNVAGKPANPRAGSQMRFPSHF